MIQYFGSVSNQVHYNLSLSAWFSIECIIMISLMDDISSFFTYYNNVLCIGSIIIISLMDEIFSFFQIYRQKNHIKFSFSSTTISNDFTYIY